jgi:hypothetical protein
MANGGRRFQVMYGGIRFRQKLTEYCWKVYETVMDFQNLKAMAYTALDALTR